MISLQPHCSAFLFPGQGSQMVGMGQELALSYPIAREIFQLADETLGFPLSQLAWEGPESDLNDTINTQPALFVHSIAALRVIEEIMPGFRPAFVAGHSMGELSALGAAGALQFSDALGLVRRRGEEMKNAGVISPGGMAAIMGLDIPTVERICREASQEAPSPIHSVQVANDNCPGQVVISGARAALEKAITLAMKAGARRAIPLSVSIASHSPLMESAQSGFNQAVQQAPVCDPLIPIIGNVTARPLTSADQIKVDLCDQLTHRVRWTGSIQFMVEQGVDTFIEIGSGSVLSGLVKRIHRQAITITCGTPADLERLATLCEGDF